MFKNVWIVHQHQKQVASKPRDIIESNSMQCTSQDTPCPNRDGRVYHVRSNECSSLLVPLSISSYFCESVLLGGLFIVPEPLGNGGVSNCSIGIVPGEDIV